MESESIEYKTSFNDSVIESLAAFSNTKGGIVWVGRDDLGKPVKGFSLGKETIQNWLNEIKQKTSPSIIPDVEIEEREGSQSVALMVTEFPIKPVAFKGKYLKRIRNANHHMAIHEIAEMHLQTFNASWDNYISGRHTLKDISIEKIGQFITLINTNRENPVSDTPLEFLRKYDLLRGDKITNACFLMFGKEIQGDTVIQVGRFSTPTIIKDSLLIQSTLFEEIEVILQFIKKHISKGYFISGKAQRDERWQYPMTALREIILNMIVHRDYQHGSDSIIKIFDDRIEFFNPGGLPASISVGQLLTGDYVSYARNKKIAELLREAGLIEKYGSGIKRVLESTMAENIADPVFSNVQHGFRVILFSDAKDEKRNVVENVVEDVVEDVVENRQNILEMIKENDTISAKSISEQIKVSERTVQRILEKLKKENIIYREGSPKGGRWIIL